jgi:hypothetical protein
MNRNLTTPPARLLGVFLLLVIAATGGAAAADGQLLESSKVFLPETAIAAMEQVEPDIRAVLGKIEIHALTVKVEGRIETDRHGHIIMSPLPAPRHGSYQLEIGHLLRTLMPRGRALTECPISTADGVKAADVAWALPESMRALGARVF